MKFHSNINFFFWFILAPIECSSMALRLYGSTYMLGLAVCHTDRPHSAAAAAKTPTTDDTSALSPYLCNSLSLYLFSKNIQNNNNNTNWLAIVHISRKMKLKFYAKNRYIYCEFHHRLKTTEWMHTINFHQSQARCSFSRIAFEAHSIMAKTVEKVKNVVNHFGRAHIAKATIQWWEQSKQWRITYISRTHVHIFQQWRKKTALPQFNLIDLLFNYYFFLIEF